MKANPHQTKLNKDIYLNGKRNLSKLLSKLLQTYFFFKLSPLAALFRLNTLSLFIIELRLKCPKQMIVDDS